MPDPSIFEPDPLDEQALLTQLGDETPLSPVVSLDQNLKRQRLKALTAAAIKRAEQQAKEEFVGPIEPERPSMSVTLPKQLGQVPQPQTPKIPLGTQPDAGPQLMVGPQEDRLTAPKIPLPDEPPPMPEPPRAGALNMMGLPYTTLSGAVGEMFDQPPEAGMSQRMTAALEGAAPAFANAPFESKAISEEARERGVETGLAGIGADILGDPGNLAGNPIVDIAKLVTALPAAIKGGVSMAHMLPLLVKGGIEAVPESRGLYSRVDELAKAVGKEGITPARLAKLTRADNALAEEAAFRKIPDLIASSGGAKTTQRTISLPSLLEHLKANPAPTPEVKTLGGPQVPQLSPEDIDARFVESHVPPGHDPKNYPGYWEAYDRRTGSLITRGSNEATVREQSLVFGPRENDAKPKYEQYQLPGGENYRETLLTLPNPKGPQFDPSKVGIKRHRPSATQGQTEITYDGKSLASYGDTPEMNAAGVYEQKPESYWMEQARRLFEQGDSRNSIQPLGGGFRSGHFDDPNILVHTRANERTLPTGERGRFIEEVQSDWHQKGKKHGYQTGENLIDGKDYQYWNDRADTLFRQRRTQGADPQLEHDLAKAQENRNRLSINAASVVPDAPFKETWPDLGLKQQILEAAKDPKAEWIGHTGGKTQAERYDLSKQIAEVHYSGSNLKAYDHDGETVLNQTGVSAKDLPDYIGKEAAEKLMAQEPKGTLRSLTGVDLQVGGEGMKHFYDNLLPKRLEKILKPFGGKVERGTIRASDFPEPATAGDRAAAAARQRNNITEGDVEAWIAKLTPEMKARINKEGLPLAALLAALGLGGAAKTQEREQ